MSQKREAAAASIFRTSISHLLPSETWRESTLLTFAIIPATIRP